MEDRLAGVIVAIIGLSGMDLRLQIPRLGKQGHILFSHLP
jgi:hypothetical protein